MGDTFAAYAAGFFEVKDYAQHAIEWFNGAAVRDGCCNRLTVAEGAYLAGIMDGEGQVALRRIKTSGGIYVEIAVTNSNQQVMEWLVQTTGVGRIAVHRAEGFKGHAWKQTWLWRVSSGRAASVLAAIRPYLIIKAQRADLALDVQGRLMWPSLRRDRSWQAEAFGRMKNLNRQGMRDAEGSPTMPARVMRGVERTNAVLTDEDVRTIRSTYAAGGISQARLAQRYGVTQATIFNVVQRISWKHVD
jgi:hypothetical protein